MRVLGLIGRVAVLAVLGLAGGGAGAQGGVGGAVLLTFDVEFQGDVEGLRALDLDVPATYFFTRDYARSHPDLVRDLVAGGNVIGSHSHFHDDLVTLSPHHLAVDLELSRLGLETIAGRPVRWFRAPYLSYDANVMQQVAAAGFRGDSSDKAPWPANPLLPELAISVFDGRLLADFDILGSADQPGPGAGFMIAAFDAHRDSGRPLVVLLHPRIIGKRAEVLGAFIDHVRANGGRMVTADDLMAAALTGADRRALVLADTVPDDATLARAVRDGAVTDLVVPMGADLSAINAAVSAPAPRVQVRVDVDAVAAGWRANATILDPPVAERVVARAGALARQGAAGIILSGLAFDSHGGGLSDDIRRAFQDETGLADQTPDAILSAHYEDWIQWRQQRVADLLDRVRRAVPKGVEVGIAMPGDVVLDYHAIEMTGIDPIRLAPFLDSVVIEPGSAGGATDERVRMAAAVLIGDAVVFNGPGAGIESVAGARLLQGGAGRPQPFGE